MAPGSWKCPFSGNWERVFLLKMALGVGHTPSLCFITWIFPPFDTFSFGFGFHLGAVALLPPWKRDWYG